MESDQGGASRGQCRLPRAHTGESKTSLEVQLQAPGLWPQAQPWQHACVCAQSCLALCDPVGVAHQAPLSTGFSGQEDWSGVSFPIAGILQCPGTELRLLPWHVDSSPPSHRRSPTVILYKPIMPSFRKSLSLLGKIPENQNTRVLTSFDCTASLVASNKNTPCPYSMEAARLASGSRAHTHSRVSGEEWLPCLFWFLTDSSPCVLQLMGPSELGCMRGHFATFCLIKYASTFLLEGHIQLYSGPIFQYDLPIARPLTQSHLQRLFYYIR